MIHHDRGWSSMIIMFHCHFWQWNVFCPISWHIDSPSKAGYSIYYRIQFWHTYVCTCLSNDGQGAGFNSPWIYSIPIPYLLIRKHDLYNHRNHIQNPDQTQSLHPSYPCRRVRVWPNPRASYPYPYPPVPLAITPRVCHTLGQPYMCKGSWIK